MLNHWIITQDHIGSNAKGIKSFNFPDNLKPESMPVSFKLYDGDNILYLSGKMMEQDFDPLDDYGKGALGCTGIKTRLKNNQFEWL